MILWFYVLRCSWTLPASEVPGGSTLHDSKHPYGMFKSESFLSLNVWAVRGGRGAPAFAGLFRHINWALGWIALSLHWPHREPHVTYACLRHPTSDDYKLALCAIMITECFFLSSFIYSFNNFSYCFCSFFDLSFW